MSRNAFPQLDREYNEQQERLENIRAQRLTPPVSTIEKPLTAIDYAACLEHCLNIVEVATFSEQLPLAVRMDERYCKAVAKRLAVIAARKVAT